MADNHELAPAGAIGGGETRRSVLTDIFAALTVATPGIRDPGGVGASMVASLSPDLNCNPRDLGAVGDGKTDDSAAFQRAFTNSTRTRRSNTYTIKGEFQAGVLIPPGRYRIASTITMPGTNILVAAQVPGTVEILLDDDTYFLTSQALITTIAIDGIKITGGKGGYRSTQHGANSAGGDLRVR
ncbi:glycoside hydrolase family 55 protein [Hephaestia sp. GCM10023244]|uniref:glycoside hydrolase family 55 protein n=1 Tax=unclassified Hephaestia TaxID=2631281 RepID=UPI002076EA96|nr:glycoside hydrolase family 55 protein [Hephaestia sp. MAHUQ-44]MCM8732407.1 glycoside hydrolase family 55 protein [Hephaestia sp. MAHUQ-44]